MSFSIFAPYSVFSLALRDTHNEKCLGVKALPLIMVPALIDMIIVRLLEGADRYQKTSLPMYPNSNYYVIAENRFIERINPVDIECSGLTPTLPAENLHFMQTDDDISIRRAPANYIPDSIGSRGTHSIIATNDK